MQKVNNPPPHTQPHSRSSAEQPKQFPHIQYRKLSLHATDQPKYLIKFTKINHTQNLTQPFRITSEKQRSPEESVFGLPKNNSFFKKRIIIAPGKYSTKEHVQDLLDNDLVRRQLESIQTRQGLNREQFAFNTALKQFGLVGNDTYSMNFRQNSRQYHGYRKRATEKQKDKLKPIISETHINNKMHGIDFFNVGRMNLIDVDKNKKSTSLLVRSTEEQIQSTKKFTKDVNSIKDRIMSKNRGLIFQHSALDEAQRSKQDIKMSTLSPRHCYNSQQLIQFLSQRIQTESANAGLKGQKVLHILRKDEQTQTKSPEKQKILPVRRQSKHFNLPFQTYYYRDLIWKVNFTNQRIVQIPLQYEHRLKVFVGKGNNSCMVSGFIARRPWFAFTDKIQQANFVWTQLKQLSFLKRQQSFKGQIGCEEREKGKYREDSILTDIDAQNFKNYFKKYFTSEERNDQRLVSRLRHMKYRQMVKAGEILQGRVHNHLINNYVLGNKKALFNTMSNYYQQMKQDVFKYLPLTFHIKQGLQDKKYFQFLRYYLKRAKQIVRNDQEKGKHKQYNAWIVKPGQNSNRGNGIKMCLTLDQIKSILKKRQKYGDGSYRTYIVQAYIQRPLLYFKRKFDIRHYIMMSCVNGIIKGYWYKHGYVRTTSSEYTLDQNAGSIHLTNDAVQKNLPDYGKYEKGNKISYDELSNYIDRYYSQKGKGFYNYIYPKMKKIATDAMRACSGGIDPAKLQNNFEIFGMDFMIDANLQVWLIEINTNPCLQLSCPLLGCIIPKMVQNTLELTLDAMFPPPVRFCPKGLHYYKQLQKENKYELVYDQRVERLYTGSLEVLDNKLLQEQDDTFEDCGQQWQQDK